MTHGTTVSRVMTCALLLLAMPAVSSAQDTARPEFSAGWRLLHPVDDEFNETFTAGWYADVGFPVTNLISLVGDVAGAYKSFEETAEQLGFRFSATADVAIHTFMGGVRVNVRSPRVTPFAQILFGLARSSADVEGTFTSGGVTFDTINESDSENEFALEAGGGVNLMLSDRVGIRIGAGYLRIGADDGGNAIRAGAGVVVPF